MHVESCAVRWFFLPRIHLILNTSYIILVQFDSLLFLIEIAEHELGCGMSG